MSNLESIAHEIQQLALELGAEEVAVSVSQSVSTELTQREGILEKSQQSNSLGVGLELLVDERFSSHSASDVRLDSLRPFLTRAIEATRFLEPDPNRRLPELHEMGSADADLDANDVSWATYTPEARQDLLNQLEASSQAAANASTANVRSLTHHVWDAKVDSHICCSNGFSTGWSRTSFGMGGEITLVDTDGRLPEAYDYRSTRHLEDLPSVDLLAEELLSQGSNRLGSSGIPSAKMPVLLSNHIASKLIRTLINPMGGTAIYEKRSCLLDKVGSQIASSNLTIMDEPHIPRGLNSRPYDGDGFATRSRTIVQDGVLQGYLLGLYNARRLKTTPTTSSTSNIVIAPSTQSPQELIADLPQVIVIDGFLGGNANAITGDFSYGITGRYFERGELVQSVSEMNISGNIIELMMQFEAAGNDVWTYSSYRLPSLLFSGVQCSGT